MSAVERVLQKVQRMNEAEARRLLAWLEGLGPLPPMTEAKESAPPVPSGARAMLGFARRFRSQARSTGEWMHELREGERD